MLSNSRQSLVKGERLVRHDMTAVLNKLTVTNATMAMSDDRGGCEPAGKNALTFPPPRKMLKNILLDELLARRPIKIRTIAGWV